MAKFMKKPIIIDAYQTGESLIIQTLEGPLHASPGDWIITGVRGEQYPCKPDIFAETYQSVPEASANVNKSAACFCPNCGRRLAESEGT